MDAGPTIKDELRTLIIEALKGYGRTASTGNRSRDRAAASRLELTDPGSRERIAVLDKLSLDGKKVLDLGAGLGDVSRAARKKGAALVDGLEQDPELVTLARLLNAYHRVTRVSFHQRNTSFPGSDSERYDLVLAFPVVPSIVPVLDTIARITDGAFVAELPPQSSGDESSALLESINSCFPIHRELAVRTASVQRPISQRAFSTWAKSEAALATALRRTTRRKVADSGRRRKGAGRSGVRKPSGSKNP